MVGSADGKFLLETSGNLSSISARSSRVSDAIARGIVGRGLLLIITLLTTKNALILLILVILINQLFYLLMSLLWLKSSKRDTAAKFIAFLLSDEGQEIIYKSDMAKILSKRNFT